MTSACPHVETSAVARWAYERGTACYWCWLASGDLARNRYNYTPTPGMREQPRPTPPVVSERVQPAPSLAPSPDVQADVPLWAELSDEDQVLLEMIGDEADGLDPKALSIEVGIELEETLTWIKPLQKLGLADVDRETGRWHLGNKGRLVLEDGLRRREVAS
jgi:hypothetical protein